MVVPGQITVGDSTPPGGQRVLLRVEAEVPPLYSAIDATGRVCARSNALGVVLAAARRILVEQGQVWLSASDDTTVRLGSTGLFSATPDAPWIASVAQALEV